MSRYFRVAGALREAGLLATLWVVYSASRLLANDDLPRARARAGDVLDLEARMHLDIESWLKSAVAPVTQIAVATSFWYALLHYLVTPAVLAVLYFRAPQDYPRARNALLVGTLIGWPPTC